jgi:hypothetical protein
MDDICKKLQNMLRDEATGILEYNKLKNEMPSEHKSHIETIEEYIADEYKHLSGVFNMMKDMGCPIEKSEEIEAKLKEMVTEENEGN